MKQKLLGILPLVGGPNYAAATVLGRVDELVKMKYH